MFHEYEVDIFYLGDLLGARERTRGQVRQLAGERQGLEYFTQPVLGHTNSRLGKRRRRGDGLCRLHRGALPAVWRQDHRPPQVGERIEKGRAMSLQRI